VIYLFYLILKTIKAKIIQKLIKKIKINNRIYQINKFKTIKILRIPKILTQKF